MANLVRKDRDFNELFDFRHTFDRLFNRLASRSAQGMEQQQREPAMLFAVPPIEAWMDPDKKEYHLSIALPGVDPKEVELYQHGNNLTVQGEHKESKEKKDADYLDQEFSYQSFQRTIVLPEGVDVQKLNADFHNGVLEVTAPIKESALPKQIEIKSGDKDKEKDKAKTAGA
ncbi:MAG TPA: Hsp20/alpha crystallin family protein [Candidatus Acidoferrum sp.]|jgi:HSP20 family molecular chaperone IbpA